MNVKQHNQISVMYHKHTNNNLNLKHYEAYLVRKISWERGAEAETMIFHWLINTKYLFKDERL